MAARLAEKTAIKGATKHTFENITELWLMNWQGDKSAVMLQRLEIA